MGRKSRDKKTAEALRSVREKYAPKIRELEHIGLNKLAPELIERSKNDAERVWIEAMHRAGKSAEEIAAERGLSLRFVREHLQTLR